ncbi:TenA family protein [Aeromicrobium piscarium]|uniref:Thiaminase II n=1 Tax=Aeromicrobium piscarium TaxID=2590901 RepID=A0A554SGK9_9ACTN|nr:TenA family protein [Aeromicrobium piscarium]TSD65485.1 thiaminase II [Aeromicrobium piscarium]
MSFSERAWHEVADVVAQIMDHPFVRGLADGTLPSATFERYLRDDAHYLDRYGRVLATLAARAPMTADVGAMAEFAAGAAVAERELHETVVGTALATSPPSAACDAYTGFLISTATRQPASVGLAAVLPCFRVYAHVGETLAAAAHPDHPYLPWLEQYGDPGFAEATRRCEAIADRWAELDPSTIPDMHDAYSRATRYELAFWESAWR